MKKLLIIGLVASAVALTACSAYHSKQPVDPEYYKRTQSVAWPEATEKPAKTTTKATTAQKAAKAQYGANSGSSFGGGSGSAGIPGAPAADPDVKWKDAADAAEAVPVPAVAEKKIQCVKADGGYTCRYGQTICGKGCQADASNCSYGYCLKSECDNVMGQKWDWVKSQTDYGATHPIYACQHPTYKITCKPHGSDGIRCRDADGYTCGEHCNKNGTDCGGGKNNCWDRYR